MLKIRLLQAVCTVAMLGAVPAFAQSNTQPPAAGAPAAQQASPDHANMPASGDKTSMAPADKDGLGVSSHSHMMHRSAMMHHNRAMHASSKTDTSQDPEIDKLNSQSYQAAQKGEAFSGGANGSGDMMKSNASGGMAPMSTKGTSGSSMSGNNMSGSGMSGNGSAGNGSSGSGASGAK